jgi:hypothetical protein
VIEYRWAEGQYVVRPSEVFGERMECLQISERSPD